MYKHPKGKQDADPEEYETKSTPEVNTIYIGTNVEYGEEVETLNRKHTTGRAHFLRDAATTHNDEYNDLMKAALQSGGDGGISGELVE